MNQVALDQTVKRLSVVDLCLIGPMAIPGLSDAIISVIRQLDQSLGFNSPITEFNSFGMLFMNVVGVLAVAWCLVRINAPTVLLAKIDVWARVATAFLIIFYVFGESVTPVVLVFLVSELLGAAIEYRAVVRR